MNHNHIEYRGALGLSLIRQNGGWRIHDIDFFRYEASAWAFRERFRNAHPAAVGIDPETGAPLPSQTPGEGVADPEPPARDALSPKIREELDAIMAQRETLADREPGQDQAFELAMYKLTREQEKAIALLGIKPEYRNMADDPESLKAFKKEMDERALLIREILRNTPAWPLQKEIEALQNELKQYQKSRDENAIRLTVEKLSAILKKQKNLISETLNKAPDAGDQENAPPKPIPPEVSALRAEMEAFIEHPGIDASKLHNDPELLDWFNTIFSAKYNAIRELLRGTEAWPLIEESEQLNEELRKAINVRDMEKADDVQKKTQALGERLQEMIEAVGAPGAESSKP